MSPPAWNARQPQSLSGQTRPDGVAAHRHHVAGRSIHLSR